MSSFETLVGNMDDKLTLTFQRVDPVNGPIEVTLHPKGGGADVTVACIVKNPLMEEDYIPGGQPGSKMLILFIPASANVIGLLGNTATFGLQDYDIVQSDIDRCGGIHIRLRIRTQPYNQ
jgi:hypothetical protein